MQNLHLIILYSTNVENVHEVTQYFFLRSQCWLYHPGKCVDSHNSLPLTTLKYYYFKIIYIQYIYDIYDII